MTDGPKKHDHDESDTPLDGPEEPYVVGRGKPPKHSQFKPGETGNPKGRKKGSRSLRSVLEKELRRPVLIRSTGKYLPAQDVIARNLVTRCANGDQKSLSDLFTFSRLANYLEPEAAQAVDAPLTESDAELIADYIRRATGADMAVDSSHEEKKKSKSKKKSDQT